MIQPDPSWSDRDGLIQATTGAKTDFWRKTHYQFICNNGHFYYQQVRDNFTAEVEIIATAKAIAITAHTDSWPKLLD